ncbi:hypothetical protein D5S17_21815 [Pseudonocardiaceae bacterium YIM PH 21723]|nr:hypothetical protein D5S17_21815 [Pseudonocardiaceae bacterium YIM PH 21723]
MIIVLTGMALAGLALLAVTVLTVAQPYRRITAPTSAISGAQGAPAPTPTPAPPGGDRSAAARAAAPQASLGIAVFDTQQGAMLTAVDADRAFDTQSVVKLLIAIDAVERDGLQQGADIGRMLSVSDDQIANRLWGQNGGSAIIRRMIGRIGLTATTLPERADYWGDTSMSAADLVKVYRYLMSRPYSGALLDAMDRATRLAADGTDQFFGIPDAVPGHRSQVKQGWAGPSLHSTGLVDDRYIVVVLTRGAQRGQVTAVAKAIIPA